MPPAGAAHDPLLERRTALALATVVLVVQGYVVHDYPAVPNPNETTRIYLTLALLEDGSLSIDGPMARYGVTWDRASVEGRLYSDKAPGLALLALPFCAVAAALERLAGVPVGPRTLLPVARLAGVALPTALFAALLFGFLRRYGLSRRERALLVLLWALATPARIYAGLFFGHQTQAVLAATGCLVLVRAGRDARAATLVLAGACLGGAVLCEYPAALTLLAALGFAVAMVRRRAALVAAGAAGPLAVLAGYHALAFGNPLRPGYAALDTAFARGQAVGAFGVTIPSVHALGGVLLSEHRGLLVMSPWLVLGAVGLGLLIRARQTRAEGLLFAVSALGSLYVASSYVYWDGGDSPGPRHLVSALPFLAVGAAPVLGRLRGAWRVLASAAAAYSLAVVGAVAATYPYFSPELALPYRDLTLALLRAGLLAPTVLGPLLPHPLDGWLHLAILLAAAVALPWLWPGPGRLRDAARAVILGGLALVWLVHHGPAGTGLAAGRARALALRALTEPSLESASSQASRTLVWEGNAAAEAGDLERATRLYRAALEPR
jgi:hypothetical protein